VKSDGLVSFEVVEKETDLLISVSSPGQAAPVTPGVPAAPDLSGLEARARESVLNHREELEGYIRANPAFYSSLEPVKAEEEAPAIVRAMAGAASEARVGPMAAVAGAIAEFVGRDLAAPAGEVIVENGGDIFLRTLKKRVIGIYAGDHSPFTGKLAIEVAPAAGGIGVCTSSGTVSHSLSFGRADAVTVISDSAALADAAATAVGNAVKAAGDIALAITRARSIKGVKGVLIIVGDKMGSWGEIKLV
jgi:ApbE superfamily uncharacterized protein (UPF0280 family)